MSLIGKSVSSTFINRALRTSSVAKQLAASPSRSLSTITVDIGEDAFSTHMFDRPDTTVTTSKEELLQFMKEMYTMRRMEITNDTEYKARNIRGFCHLYDGQEAIASGTQAALSLEDSWITSYRCHCIALLRGSTVEQVFAEMFGFETGSTKGKGGSMHFYSKKHNFYGGQGIVGAQVPVGAGLAFANKYSTPEGQPMPVAIAVYGDGAANQGQIWEAANMAKLWGLPLGLIIENNQFGMGTSTNRSSCNTMYYTMGGRVIPGLRINGMNVLAVKEGMSKAKAFMAAGNGPMYIEMDTYRYHGHSMSDPGTTYRTREEVGGVRQARDPIEYVKRILVENDMCTTDELKAIEKDIRNQVQEALTKAKASKFPEPSELVRDIYCTPDFKDEPVGFIRMPDYTKSIVNGKL